MAGKDTRSRQTASPARVRESRLRTAPRVETRELPLREPLFLRLARMLDPADLETALLEEMRARLPQATAMVSLDPGSPEPSRVMDDQGIHRWRQAHRPPRLLAVPLSDLGDASGWIAYLDDAQLRQQKPNAAAHLLEIAAAAAIPARNARRHADALELTLRDPLTGLYNRRAYEAFLEREEQRARRGGQSLALILIDLDHFKSLNDTYGHPIGDRALLLLSQVLLDAVRRSDIVARPGGDEFSIVLPETGAAGAARIASRIRRRLGETPLICGSGIEPFHLSISCGIADLDDARGEAETMIHLADKALYEAKRSGRNQVLRAARQ